MRKENDQISKKCPEVPALTLRHAKSAVCIIRIFIDTPVIAYAMVSSQAVDVVHLNKLYNKCFCYYTVALLCQCVIVNKQM